MGILIIYITPFFLLFYSPLREELGEDLRKTFQFVHAPSLWSVVKQGFGKRPNLVEKFRMSVIFQIFFFLPNAIRKKHRFIVFVLI